MHAIEMTYRKVDVSLKQVLCAHCITISMARDKCACNQMFVNGSVCVCMYVWLGRLVDLCFYSNVK